MGKIPSWIAVRNILDASEIYQNFFSLWHSSLSSDSDKQMMRETDKFLRRQLEQNVKGEDNARDLKESWKEIAMWSDIWEQKHKSKVVA